MHEINRLSYKYLRRSKPQTVCLNAMHTRRAINFSVFDKIIGYRTSFPSLSRSTLPSNAGDLRASA